MDKRDLWKRTKGAQNKFKLILDFALYDKAQIFANESSKERGRFPDNDAGMKKPPLSAIFRNFRSVRFTLASIVKSYRLTKKFRTRSEDKEINELQFNKIYEKLKSLGMDQIGYVRLGERDIFTHLGEPLGIPYEHLLIFTDEQDKARILTSPSVESQMAVMDTYGSTGNASNEISMLLDDMGFGAMPSHSLGGVIDYTRLAMEANLGYPGRHGCLIEPISGANNRIGAVFTNISNLGGFLHNTQDFTWIADFCRKCGKCVRACPAGAIFTESKTDENGFVTSMDYNKCNMEFGTKYGCNYCIAICPFTVQGYEKIKNAFMRDTTAH